jgi:hypothetical protein
MIVVGLDVHKHSLTAVAVDEPAARSLSTAVWPAARTLSAGRGRLSRRCCGRLRIADM